MAQGGQFSVARDTWASSSPSSWVSSSPSSWVSSSLNSWASSSPSSWANSCPNCWPNPSFCDRALHDPGEGLTSNLSHTRHLTTRPHVCSPPPLQHKPLLLGKVRNDSALRESPLTRLVGCLPGRVVHHLARRLPNHGSNRLQGCVPGHLPARLPGRLPVHVLGNETDRLRGHELVLLCYILIVGIERL